MIRSNFIRLTFLVKNISISSIHKNYMLYSSPRITSLNSPNNLRCCSHLPSIQNNEKQPEIKNNGKMQIIFTCTVCNTRNSRTFSKISYEKGIVIIECEKCKNNHLIADNLGWFPDIGCKNIEEVLTAKGEKVKRINGCWEITSNSK